MIPTPFDAPPIVWAILLALSILVIIKVVSGGGCPSRNPNDPVTISGHAASRAAEYGIEERYLIRICHQAENRKLGLGPRSRAIRVVGLLDGQNCYIVGAVRCGVLRTVWTEELGDETTSRRRHWSSSSDPE